MNAHEFVAKWRGVTLKERSAAQEHFLNLCALVHHPTPASEDPTGTHFTFEAGLAKTGGGQGWADVWKRRCFGWEYKGKHADLQRAYEQLLKYREALENPPLLVVCDMDAIVVHTNFTNTVKRIVTIDLDDLTTPQGMQHLRNIFYDPTAFRSEQTTEQVTREAATEFAKLADHLRQSGEDSETIAHFLIRLLFCLFAEDIDLLPNNLFSDLVNQGRSDPAMLNQQMAQLFGYMAHGGWFGRDKIRYFNGGLFDSDATLALDRAAIHLLHGVAALDWSGIEPSILGTLFERSLDPGKRAQLGAHYTSKEDILLIVEPVLMAPLRRRWEEVQVAAQDIADRRDRTSDAGARTRRQNELSSLLASFSDEIAATRVLDPACGSGNFLYVALQQMLDLEKELSVFAGQVGLPGLFPQVSPAQLYGIEINAYAHELASATVWIGYIQWLHENGYGVPAEPILKPLDNIKQMDAILAYDADGKPVEPEWPEAEILIGNPPFLGDKKMRADLDDKYVDDLRFLYDDKLRGQSDLVCYWFERARSLVDSGDTSRVGLLATNSIRHGTNRYVLDKIMETGSIFMGWRDRGWTLEGAAVRVSLIGFDKGIESEKYLDGQRVNVINADLTAHADITQAQPLDKNQNICFLGVMKAGSFDIEGSLAREMLQSSGNPNGRPNSDVVKPRMGGMDISRRPRDIWIIDFGVDMILEEASQYEVPFEYIKSNVKQVREKNRRKKLREQWWIHGEARPGLRNAMADLARCIVTPEVSKYRIFVWMDTSIIPDHKVHVITRDDDYFFGVLQSKFHEIWSLTIGSWMGAGNDPSYSSSRTFLTFPFPWPPGTEPTDDPRVHAIAAAAQELNEKRERWLNPPDLSEKELKKRTLTNLYNQRPTWLDLAHRKLDQAVAAAYGWADDPADLDDETILERLLALNLERAAGE